MKKILTLVLIACVALAWFVTFRREVRDEMQYHSYVQKAEESVEDGLYEQAVEYYEAALKLKPKKTELYKQIKETDKLYFDEQKTGKTKDRYLKSLISCCENRPYDQEVWDELIEYYMFEGEYTNADLYLRKAERNKLSDTYLDEVRQELKYYYELDRRSFDSYAYLPWYEDAEAGGLYIAHGMETYWIENETGKTMSDDFDYIGMLNGEGKAVYKDPSGFVIKDKYLVTRQKLDMDIDRAGQISCGLIPVCKGDVWYYIREDGEKAFGDYQYASSFIHDKAAVQKDDVWMIVDTDGNPIENGQFEEIRLSEDDHYLHRDKYVIAKRDGRYRLYDAKLKPIGNLACDEMDIYAGGDLIAFRMGDDWGYADLKGNVVIQPQYAKARSFSGGFGAVMNKDELWGFILEDGTAAIDYTFCDAGYFNSANECLVSDDSVFYSLLKFRFQN